MVTPEPTSEPAPPQAASDGLALWQWILIVIGGLAVFRTALKMIVKGADVVEGEKTKEAVYKAWNTPAHLFSGFGNKERDMFYGDLIDRSPSMRMIVPWDRSFILNWLDKKIAELEPKITNTTLLRYAHEIRAAPDTKPVHYDDAEAYCKALKRNEMAWYEGQDAIELGYFLLSVLGMVCIGARITRPALCRWGIGLMGPNALRET